MKKSLLIKMIKLANKNHPSKHLVTLALQIAADDNLVDIVNIDSFSNEDYTVRDIHRIKQCFNFKLI